MNIDGPRETLLQRMRMPGFPQSPPFVSCSAPFRFSVKHTEFPDGGVRPIERPLDRGVPLEGGALFSALTW